MREWRKTLQPPKKHQEKPTIPITKVSEKSTRRCLVLKASDPFEILVNTPSSISSSSSSFIDPQSPAFAFLKTYCDNQATVHSTEQLRTTVRHDNLTVCASESNIHPIDVSAIDYNSNLNPLAAPVDVVFADMSLVDNIRERYNSIEGDNTNIDEWLTSAKHFAAATPPTIPIDEALSTDFSFFMNSDQTTSVRSRNTLQHVQNLDFINNSDLLSLFNSSVNISNRNFVSESCGGEPLSFKHCSENSGVDVIDIMDIELTEEDLNILESLV
ncbi:hypothetical protein HK100_002712 [Physocladia obscura]|uniref:Uncharacterized protein n=1 Tax=Physocladia obscura TaxID=109957 RepID=A0AAD5SV94_9FUNG|nr:hypothetical protein HK100_002712 [Physocladia obscura]